MALDKEIAAIRAANPAENGPALKIDRTDSRVIQRLTELKDQIENTTPPLNRHEAPEQVNDKVQIQLPLIVDSLIANGIVYAWALSRNAPGYPYAIKSFAIACELVANIEGVEEVPPAVE